MNPGVLIFAVLFGIAGYAEANRYLKRYGRTPFGWPAIVWGVVCFLCWVIGAILLAIGERIIRNRAAQTPMYGGSYTQPVYAAPPGYGPQNAYGPPAQYGPPPQQTQSYGTPAQHPLGYGPPPQQPQSYGPPPQQPPVYAAPAQPALPVQSAQATQPTQFLSGDILPK